MARRSRVEEEEEDYSMEEDGAEKIEGKQREQANQNPQEEGKDKRSELRRQMRMMLLKGEGNCVYRLEILMKYRKIGNEYRETW
jgi:hypothetical protein